MTRKRFKKLLMALGYDRDEVNECMATAKEYEQTPIINACMYRVVTIPVPAYRNRAMKEYGEMHGLYHEGHLTDKQLGKYVRVISRCYMATKHCFMVDIRKKGK